MINTSDFYYVPLIAGLCFSFIEMLKRTFKNNKKLKNAYPLISTIFGALLGVIIFVLDPFVMQTDSMFTCIFMGMTSGLSATGGNEMVQRIKKITRNNWH